jgi:hypothetical protein
MKLSEAAKMPLTVYSIAAAGQDLEETVSRFDKLVGHNNKPAVLLLALTP